MVLHKLAEIQLQQAGFGEKQTAIEAQQTEINSRLPAIQEDVEASAAIIRFIPALLSNLAHRTFNPYTESVISTDRDPNFRADVVAHYYPQPTVSLLATASFSSSSASSSSSSAAPAASRTVKDAHGGVACMVSGQLGSEKQVICAHIHPHSSPIDILNYAGLTRAEVESERNGLLLAEGIEDAFDRLDLSFVPLSPLTPERYVMKIWTRVGLAASGTLGKKSYHPGDARSLPLWRSKKNPPPSIGCCDGCELLYGVPPQPPLRRALSYQAWLAYDRAVKLEWIDASSEPPPIDFGTPNDSPFQRQRRLSVSAAQQEDVQTDDEDDE